MISLRHLITYRKTKKKVRERETFKIQQWGTLRFWSSREKSQKGLVHSKIHKCVACRCCQGLFNPCHLKTKLIKVRNINKHTTVLSPWTLGWISLTQSSKCPNLKTPARVSVVVLWFSLAMQGTLVPSLVWEDPTCLHGDGHGQLSPCPTTPDPAFWIPWLQQLSPCTTTTEALEPTLHERPPQWEARTLWLERSPCLLQLERSPHSNENPAEPKINTYFLKNLPKSQCYWLWEYPKAEADNAKIFLIWIYNSCPVFHILDEKLSKGSVFYCDSFCLCWW